MTAYNLTDTIIAPATALAESAIGVVRLSGPDAWRISRELCSSLPRVLQARKAYVVEVGTRLASSQVAQETAAKAAATGEWRSETPVSPRQGSPTETAVLTLWQGPRSYTGEDMAELSVHGNPLLLRAVADAAFAAASAENVSLRHAEAGEFTYRAYLNGKLDLAQAEAVQQVISASSTRALTLAQSQLAGGTSRRVRAWVERLINLLARIEVTHDYGSDDLDATLDPALLFTPDQVRSALAALSSELADAQDEAERSAPLRAGITVAICGPPNVGKSTLFNALLGEERALTAAEPGTTRDYLTESLHADGLRLKLVDTAGYRDAADAVEAAGVRRAGDWARAADKILLWVTAADGARADGEQRMAAAFDGLEPVNVITRCDRLEHWPPDEPGCLHVSGVSGRGIAGLRALLQARASALGDPPLDSLTERQARQAASARDVLEQACAALDDGMPLDAVAQDLYAAVAELRQVYEHPDREAVVQAVFSGFCVGK